MSSSIENAAVVAPSVKTTAVSDANKDMEEETKILMHNERSCIFESRIEHADCCRQRGSIYFKDGDTEKAVTWYERALHHVDFDEGSWHFEFTEKNREDVNVVRLPVYLNLAACFLRQGAPIDGEKHEGFLAKVVENVNLALAIDPENDKALYRGGRALLLMGDLEGAKEKLTKAVKHHPTDRNIREAMVTLKKKLAEHKKVAKECWGGRLLDEKETDVIKIASKQQQKQEQQKNESSNALWMFAVVLIGIALALGQLSFVE
ncbi:unnamed protein product [Peronospora belbahrii]|uniref:Peptidylprolyl isomerase n=1 Tax=Peronospora belbahrii TaxID=622444 RepID=A0ABN8CUK6_9STRA|nr:unnamed protein product [Peronospora belbahrii]